MIFTEALRLYCKEHGITINKLASLTGISHAMAQRLMDGKTINYRSFVKVLTWMTSDKQ